MIENNKACGVKLFSGETINAKNVISACTPYHTFLELIPGGYEKGVGSFENSIRFLEHGCGAFKINCAVKELPQFKCYPVTDRSTPGP